MEVGWNGSTSSFFFFLHIPVRCTYVFFAQLKIRGKLEARFLNRTGNLILQLKNYKRLMILNITNTTDRIKIAW